MRDALRRLAMGAPVPVFAVAGAGAREMVQDLRLSHRVRLVDTPRAASVILVAGAIPEALLDPLARVHDALPHPRCTVRWHIGLGPDAVMAALPEAMVATASVEDTIVQAQRDMLAGRRMSEKALLPDVEPAPWRGVGPYGQGGSGMTGGTPYGRPMAGLGPDRDGLRLDVLPVKVGPYFPHFPTGLAFNFSLAGDVVVSAGVEPNPYLPMSRLPRATWRPGLQPFARALVERVSVAELELARARDHLRWVAGVLLLHGLPRLAERALDLARTVRPGDGAAVRGLARTLGWTQIARWSAAGVGRLAVADLVGLGAGPVARAGGLAEDARTDDAAYRELGFESILLPGGDAAARWRLRLAEAAQSLDLAARAGDRLTQQVGQVESPRGRLTPESAPATRLLPLLARWLPDLEWGDAITTLISLDLDLEEAAMAADQSRVVPVAA